MTKTMYYIAAKRIMALTMFSLVVWIGASSIVFYIQLLQAGIAYNMFTIQLPMATTPVFGYYYAEVFGLGAIAMWLYMSSGQAWREYK